MKTERPKGSLRPQTKVTVLLAAAPQEALRILGESINFARKGQPELRPAK